MLKHLKKCVYKADENIQSSWKFKIKKVAIHNKGTTEMLKEARMSKNKNVGNDTRIVILLHPTEDAKRCNNSEYLALNWVHISQKKKNRR